MRLLGHYVEIMSDGDMPIFTSSGFLPASTTKVGFGACQALGFRVFLTPPTHLQIVSTSAHGQ
jgi:hypothetical protein